MNDNITMTVVIDGRMYEVSCDWEDAKLLTVILDNSEDVDEWDIIHS